MNHKELLQKRYSVRTFLPNAIEKEKLEYILECGRLAPSACNFQPWLFYVVSSDEARMSLQEVYPREWFKTAPSYIVVCGDRSQSWKRPADNKDHYDVDVSIAAEHISFAAESLGLGTCWVCNFNPVKLSSFLDLPSHIEPVVVLPVGYIDADNSNVPDKKRKPFPDIVKWL